MRDASGPRRSLSPFSIAVNLPVPELRRWIAGNCGIPGVWSFAAQAPGPLSKIPIVVGGAGAKTLAIVRDHADWWNLDIRHRNKYSGGEFEDLRAQIGNARVSLQVMLAFVPDEAQRKEITQTAQRRFGFSQPQIGNSAELLEYFSGLQAQGVERVYLWFCDFAQAETLAAFGKSVIEPLART